MANLHHRHAQAWQAQQISLSFLQHRKRQDGGPGAEVINAFVHCDSSSVGNYSPYLGRSALPATLITTERGRKRSASTMSRLVQPETTLLFCRASPRRAAATTSSAVCAARMGGRSTCAASKKFVSVTPGHKA